MGWLLFIPSIYFFTIYDAYVNAVEGNNLFNSEMKALLKKEFNHVNVSSSSQNVERRGRLMHVIASFYYSLYIEIALAELEQRGIARSDMFAV